MDKQALREYFKKLGIMGAPTAVQEVVLSEIGIEIMKQLFMDLRGALSEDAFSAVEKAAVSGDLGQITEALKIHMPEAESFIKKSAEKVIAGFIEASKSGA